jgi:hypothetical protein
MRTGVISVAKEIDDNELLAYTVKVIFTYILVSVLTDQDFRYSNTISPI